LSALITVDGKTLEGATQHVMNKALQVCGGMGADLPTEQFHEFIWDFYKMPVIVAKTAIQEANEKRKIDAAEASVQRMAEMQAKKVEMPVATPIIKSKGKNISIDQMSMFDLFTSRTTDEDDGEGEGKENSANEEENVEPDLFEIEDNELETEEEIEEELI